METIVILLIIQGILGGIDNLWHHEIKERLPSKISARVEVGLHGVRELSYGMIFLAVAWGQWYGAYAWVLMGLLVRYSRTLVVAALVHPMSNLGVLWVGAQYAGYHGGWLGYLAYYPLQIVLGIIFIPALLAAATGTFRWPDWLRPPKP